MKYYIAKTVSYPFDEVVKRTIEELKNEGFGVLSEIDIHDKLKEKLDIDFRKYKILGACHPPSAYRALQAEDKIGVMLPCNVIVQEHGENEIEVAAVDPVASMMAVENGNLSGIANDIKQRLVRVISAI
jgi:uncharacterized protein (DUF302 family)